MTAIRTFFVHARHWQVFAIFGAAFLIAGTAAFLSDQKGNEIGISPTTLIVVELCWIIFLLWFWSLGWFLNSLVEASMRPGLQFFRFALSYPLVYMAVFQILFERLTASYILAIFPFHLLAMFCMFFNLNFVSKNLALTEARRPVSFYDYAGPFFLLWFFPIGVWFIQPRINRLYAATLSQQNA